MAVPHHTYQFFELKVHTKYGAGAIDVVHCLYLLYYFLQLIHGLHPEPKDIAAALDGGQCAHKRPHNHSNGLLLGNFLPPSPCQTLSPEELLISVGEEKAEAISRDDQRSHNVTYGDLPGGVILVTSRGHICDLQVSYYVTSRCHIM